MNPNDDMALLGRKTMRLIALIISTKLYSAVADPTSYILMKCFQLCIYVCVQWSLLILVVLPKKY